MATDGSQAASVLLNLVTPRPPKEPPADAQVRVLFGASSCFNITIRINLPWKAGTRTLGLGFATHREISTQGSSWQD